MAIQRIIQWRLFFFEDRCPFFHIYSWLELTHNSQWKEELIALSSPLPLAHADMKATSQLLKFMSYAKLSCAKLSLSLTAQWTKEWQSITLNVFLLLSWFQSDLTFRVADYCKTLDRKSFRLCFAKNLSLPNFVWASCVSQEKNFSFSER